jgi:hypothetical protein
MAPQLVYGTRLFRKPKISGYDHVHDLPILFNAEVLRQQS